MKTFITFFILLFTANFVYSAQEIGGFRIGSRGWNVLSSNNMVIYAIPDPQISGATCFISTIQVQGLTLSSDPSDTSIACRQTGEISLDDLSLVNSSSEGEVIFSANKGGLNKSVLNLFKEMHVRRIYIEDMRTILYASYTTKAIEGHIKHSLSAITLP